jgi:hypothetical protein
MQFVGLNGYSSMWLLFILSMNEVNDDYGCLWMFMILNFQKSIENFKIH